MIYQFPTNSDINSALKGEIGASIESFIDTRLPKGKFGNIVSLAIEIQHGSAITPFLNTKVPIGKRDKLIEISFLKNNSFFICASESKSRSVSQLIDFAEITEYVSRTKPARLDLIPIYIVTDILQNTRLVEFFQMFRSCQLRVIQRTLLCNTLNSWQS